MNKQYYNGLQIEVYKKVESEEINMSEGIVFLGILFALFFSPWLF